MTAISFFILSCLFFVFLLKKSIIILLKYDLKMYSNNKMSYIYFCGTDLMLVSKTFSL